MKRSIIVLVVCLILTTFCAVYSDANEYKYSAGDTDLSGETDMKDVLLLRKYLAKVEDSLPSITVKDGADGKNAFEIAQENGFEGTLDDWMNSLKGEPGTNGKSAYELALENGFEGTLNDWIESLKGEPGIAGKSVFEIAQENGFEGTFDDWMNSLKGEPGTNGKSAYELALENGFEGTLNDWMNSLNGSDGRGIVSIQFENDKLVVYYSDGTSQNIGDFSSIINEKVMEQVSSMNVLVFNLLEDGTLEVSVNDDYKSFIDEIIIPNQYYGKPVSTIKNNGFSYCDSLKTISIPDSITKIGDNAFECCKSLENVYIPSSVKSIGRLAFGSCDAMKELVFENNSELQTIGEHTFAFCNSLSLVDFGDTSKISEIGACAFYKDEALKEITIPESVLHIGRDAFKNSGLQLAFFEEPQKWKMSKMKEASEQVMSEKIYIFNDPSEAAGLLTKKEGYIQGGDIWSEKSYSFKFDRV